MDVRGPRGYVSDHALLRLVERGMGGRVTGTVRDGERHIDLGEGWFFVYEIEEH